LLLLHRRCRRGGCGRAVAVVAVNDGASGGHFDDYRNKL
jgi:hypothetical protein